MNNSASSSELGTASEAASARETSIREDSVVGRAGLDQPWRAGVAFAEIVIACSLGYFAWLCWGNGIIPVTVSGPDSGAGEVVTRFIGSWLVLAMGSLTVAGLVALDSVREVVLASRVRRSRKAQRQGMSGLPAEG